MPECPREMEYVLEWFSELHQERGHDALGQPETISSEKLGWWCRLNRIALTAFELEAIRRLDQLFMSGKYDPPESE